VFKTYIEQLQQLSGHKQSKDYRKGVISNKQSEGTESQKYFRMQREQFELV
jgi:hypothetical protein